MILLDAHALCWARAHPQRLPARALASIDSAGCQVLPTTPNIAAAVADLGDEFPTRDPADQIIWATSTVHQLRLVSADGRLRSYDDVVVWD